MLWATIRARLRAGLCRCPATASEAACESVLSKAAELERAAEALGRHPGYPAPIRLEARRLAMLAREAASPMCELAAMAREGGEGWP